MDPEEEVRLYRFRSYWENAERIRERNRSYYYKKRGLPVPEKREYKLRMNADREQMMRQLKAWDQSLKDQKKELEKKEKEMMKGIQKKLEAREKELATREKNLQREIDKRAAEIAKRMTTKVIVQEYVRPKWKPAQAQPDAEPEPVPAPPSEPAWSPNHTISIDDFK